MNYLDNEEKDLAESLETLDTSTVENPSEQFRTELKDSAAQFLKKETKMNIRVDPVEMQKIRDMAAREGLKYQTFVKSILHKYVTGQLIEKKYVKD